jgi:ParB family transcriptional regulator, chromosome partitioning protein
MNYGKDFLSLGHRGDAGGGAIRPETTVSSMDLRSIRVDMIDPDPGQPRKTFDEAKLDELAGSLREHGLLQPIRVRPNAAAPGRFFLVAGERRWRAAQRVPMVEIDAVIVPQRTGDDRTKIEQVIENLQREEMNAVEEGDSYRVLLDSLGCSQADLARRLSKSTAHVSRMLAVTELDDETRRKIVSGEIAYGDALRERDRLAAAATAAAEGKTMSPRPRRRAAVPRGTIPTPFGTVKLKRGKTLGELVEYLRTLVDQEKRDAA